MKKVFKTCNYSLAFTIIRTVCCSERIKYMWSNWKGCVQIMSSLLLDYHKSHPCYVKNTILYVTSTVPYNAWLIQMTLITFHSHFWWNIQNLQIRKNLFERIIMHQTLSLFQFFCLGGHSCFWFDYRDDSNSNVKKFVNSRFPFFSWCKNSKYFAQI